MLAHKIIISTHIAHICAADILLLLLLRIYEHVRIEHIYVFITHVVGAGGQKKRWAKKDSRE